MKNVFCFLVFWSTCIALYLPAQSQTTAWRNPYADAQAIRLDATDDGQQIICVSSKGATLIRPGANNEVVRMSFDSTVSAHVKVGFRPYGVLIDTVHGQVWVGFRAPSIGTRLFRCQVDDTSWSQLTTTLMSTGADTYVHFADRREHVFMLGGTYSQTDAFITTTWSYCKYYFPLRNDSGSSSNFVFVYRPSLKASVQQSYYYYYNSRQQPPRGPSISNFVHLVENGKTKSIGLDQENAIDFLDSTRFLYTQEGVFDYYNKKLIRKAPIGEVANDRFIVHRSASKKELRLYDLYNERDHGAVFNSGTEIMNFMVSNNKKRLIVATADSIFNLDISQSIGLEPVESRYVCSKKDVEIGDSIAFTNRTYPRRGLKFVWDFGDGGVDTSEYSSHYYTRAGLYRPRLGILSSSGDTLWSISNTVITVSEPERLLSYRRYSAKAIRSLHFNTITQRFIASSDSGEVIDVIPLSTSSATIISPQTKNCCAAEVCIAESGKILYALNTFRKPTKLIYHGDMGYLSYLTHTCLVRKNMETGTVLLDTLSQCYDVRSRVMYDPTMRVIVENNSVVSDHELHLSADGKWLVGSINHHSKSSYHITTNFDGKVSRDTVSVRSGNLYRHRIADNTTFVRDNFDSIRLSQIYPFDLRYDTTSRAVFSSCINSSSTRYLTSENKDFIKSQAPAFITEYELETGRELRRWSDSSAFVRYLADGHSFLTRSGVYDLDKGELIRSLSMGNPEQAELLPNKNHVLLLGTDTSRISIYNIVDGTYTTHYYLKGMVPTSMALSSDGNVLAVGTKDGSIMLFSLPNYALNDVDQETAQMSNFRAHPNPAQNELSVHCNSDGLVRITDVCGRVQIQTLCPAGSHTIDIQRLSPGSYTIECQSSSSTEFRRLVVFR